MNFEDVNFSIDKYVGDVSIDGLNRIKIYLDYSLNTTIKKQIPDINIVDEKLYAKELLCNYFKGDLHAFTSKNNIRHNIYKIGNDMLLKLFIKCMIEKQAYNILIKKIEGSSNYGDQCCNYITNRVARDHYDDVIEWLNDDFDNIEELINNYVNIFYQRKYEECMDLQKLAFEHEMTARAIRNL